jgi:hypothetical protein
MESGEENSRKLQANNKSDKKPLLIANSSKKSSKKLIEVPNMNDFKLDLGVENRGE